MKLRFALAAGVLSLAAAPALQANAGVAECTPDATNQAPSACVYYMSHGWIYGAEWHRGNLVDQNLTTACRFAPIDVKAQLDRLKENNPCRWSHTGP